MNATMLLSYEQAVADLAGRCKENGNPPSVELADKGVSMLSPEGYREAARIGLVRGAGDFLHTERS